MFNCQNLRTAKRKVRLLVEHVDFVGHHWDIFGDFLSEKTYTQIAWILNRESGIMEYHGNILS